MTSASFRLFLAGLSAAAALYPGFAAETPPVALAAPQVLSLAHAEATIRLEQLIRSYDPCISCATHFLKLEVQRD